MDGQCYHLAYELNKHLKCELYALYSSYRTDTTKINNEPVHVLVNDTVSPFGEMYIDIRGIWDSEEEYINDWIKEEEINWNVNKYVWFLLPIKKEQVIHYIENDIQMNYKEVQIINEIALLESLSDKFASISTAVVSKQPEPNDVRHDVRLSMLSR